MSDTAKAIEKNKNKNRRKQDAGYKPKRHKQNLGPSEVSGAAKKKLILQAGAIRSDHTAVEETSRKIRNKSKALLKKCFTLLEGDSRKTVDVETVRRATRIDDRMSGCY